MKFIKLLAILISIFLFFMGTDALSQGQRGQGKGKGKDKANKANQTQRLYDVNAVETFKGEITDIEIAKSSKDSIGIRLYVKKPSETVEVRVGPAWFIEENGFDFDNGDIISVTGSKIKMSDDFVIVAASIIKNGKTLKLREKDGTPLWKGSGKNNK